MSARRTASCLGIATCIAALLLPRTAIAAPAASVSLVVRVLDESAGVVPNARVSAFTRDARIGTVAITAADGTAAFDALPPGEYVVEVERDGFSRAIRIVDVSDMTGPIAITISPARVAEHVVVTASSDLRQPSEVSKAITVVTREEIEANDWFSIADALRTVPGLSIAQLGGPGAFTTVAARGMRPEDTAVLIDGARFRDAASPQGDASAFFSDLYVVDVDRVEVLRGSGSSLYGTNAIGGVVNIISRTGVGRTSGEGAYEGGSLGFTRGGAHAGGSGWRGRVAYSAGAERTRVTRGVDGNDATRSTGVQGRADVRMSSSARVTLRVYDANASAFINESPAAIGPLPPSGFVVAQSAATFVPAADDPDSQRVSRFRSALLRFEQRPVASTGYTVSWQHLTTGRTFRDGPAGTGFEPRGTTRSNFDGRVDTVEARTDRSWLGQVTTAAYEFEREGYESRSAPADPAAGWASTLTEHTHALSVQHQAQVESVYVAAAFRAQRFAIDRVRFEPTSRAPFASGAFAAPPGAFTADLSAARAIGATGTTLRAHAGNGYRAPSMFERAGASFGSRGYTVYGDPRLLPERSFAFDAGVEQEAARGHVRLSAMWFQTRLTRIIAFGSFNADADPFGRRSGYRNADGRMARGGELSVRAQAAARLQVTAAYTYADAPAPAGDAAGLPRAAGVPAHQFSFVLLQRVHNAELSARVEAVSAHYLTLFDPVSFDSRAYRFSSLATADVAVSYVIPFARGHVRVLGVLDNLLDREYYVQGFRAAGRTARAGAEVRF